MNRTVHAVLSSVLTDGRTVVNILHMQGDSRHHMVMTMRRQGQQSYSCEETVDAVLTEGELLALARGAEVQGMRIIAEDLSRCARWLDWLRLDNGREAHVECLRAYNSCISCGTTPHTCTDGRCYFAGGQ